MLIMPPVGSISTPYQFVDMDTDLGLGDRVRMYVSLYYYYSLLQGIKGGALAVVLLVSVSCSLPGASLHGGGGLTADCTPLD